MAHLLRSRGFEAYAILGGFGGWREAGCPTEPKQAERGRGVADVCPDCNLSLAAHQRGRVAP